MKSNPYFANDKEKQALIAMRDAFTFDAAAPNNINIMIAGQQNTGKTHLLCTLAGEEYGPLYLLDTEQRAQHVTQKFDTTWVHRGIVRNYQELVAAMKWVMKNVKAPAILGIDSGTDLQKYAEEKYLDDVGRERMGMPITYPQMYSYIYAVIDDLKNSGFTVAWTTKVKDEYLGDKSTGKKIPRIFQDLPYRADVGLQIDERTGKIICTKNGFTDRRGQEFAHGTTLPEIIEHLALPTTAAVAASDPSLKIAL
jgi:hypothetical protein